MVFVEGLHFGRLRFLNTCSGVVVVLAWLGFTGGRHVGRLRYEGLHFGSPYLRSFTLQSYKPVSNATGEVHVGGCTSIGYTTRLDLLPCNTSHDRQLGMTTSATGHRQRVIANRSSAPDRQLAVTSWRRVVANLS